MSAIKAAQIYASFISRSLLAKRRHENIFGVPRQAVLKDRAELEFLEERSTS